MDKNLWGVPKDPHGLNRVKHPSLREEEFKVFLSIESLCQDLHGFQGVKICCQKILNINKNFNFIVSLI